MIVQNETKECRWISAYLYCKPPVESLLIREIKPLLDTLYDTGIIVRYFFIRYLENGHHIRLRILLAESSVKDLVIENINQYFTFRNTDSLKTSELVTDVSEIQFIEYEQEVSRYGGSCGILVAEKQFEASSDLVLQIISDAFEHWNYSVALGAALKIHIAFIFAMNLGFEKSTKFAKYIVHNFLPVSLINVNSVSATTKNVEQILISFRNTYESQKVSINEDLATFYVQLTTNNSPNHYKIWLSKMTEIFSDLERLYKNNELVLVSNHFQDDYYDSSLDQSVWPILSSYIHMTNNRLGIKNVDEAFVFYLVEQVLITSQLMHD